MKILSYSETKHLIACGQVSKKIRRISQDVPWRTVNLEKKIVKTELLEMILSKGCQNLNMSNSTIIGSLSLYEESQLRVLDISKSTWAWPSCSGDIEVLEEILFSCHSLQELKMERLLLTPTMANNICKNGKTLQKLNLKHSVVKIVFCCIAA